MVSTPSPNSQATIVPSSSPGQKRSPPQLEDLQSCAKRGRTTTPTQSRTSPQMNLREEEVRHRDRMMMTLTATLRHGCAEVQMRGSCNTSDLIELRTGNAEELFKKLGNDGCTWQWSVTPTVEGADALCIRTAMHKRVQAEQTGGALQQTGRLEVELFLQGEQGSNRQGWERPRCMRR